MDRVIALYRTPLYAERARTQLLTQGMASDQVDVVSRISSGRVTHMPRQSDAEDLTDYFRQLLTEDREVPVVIEIVDDIHMGKAALVVHPHRQMETEMIRPVIEVFEPDKVIYLRNESVQHGRMDGVIALYPALLYAERARTQLLTQGMASGQVDVVSRISSGRTTHMARQSDAEDLTDYFQALLTADREVPVVIEIVDDIHMGKAALVVHPHGRMEAEMIRPVIEVFDPDKVFWRVGTKVAQGGLLGGHAA